MITAAAPPRLLLPALVNSANTNRPAACFQFASPGSRYLQCSQYNADSLPLFATDFLCFHPLTHSFHKNRGGGDICSQAFKWHPIYSRPKRGKAPARLGGGESGAWRRTARTGP